MRQPERNNPYVMCRSNPYVWRDPSGRIDMLEIEMAAIGVANLAMQAVASFGPILAAFLGSPVGQRTIQLFNQFGSQAGPAIQESYDLGMAYLQTLQSAPATLAGNFASEDVALGVFEELEAFAGEAQTGNQLLRGVTRDASESLAESIINLVSDYIERTGGAIRFNLQGLDLRAAFDPSSPLYQTYTSEELRLVLADAGLRAQALFYGPNRVVMTGTEMLEYIKGL
jgi:hypothetical protein